MADKSTPKPWRTRQNDHEAPDDMIVMDEAGASICDCAPGNPDMTIEEAKANAAGIVKAHNRDHLFGELVKALKVYADPDHWQEMTGEFLVHETDDDDRIVFDAGELARAVLAKVEEEGGG